MSRTEKRATDEDANPELPSPVPYWADVYHGGGLLVRLAEAVALAGGLLLVGVMGMTVISVSGRYLFDAPIPGDYEITELACGIAVFAFFPYAHLRNANIVIHFFTRNMRWRHKAILDTVHSIVFAAVAALISWRLFVGGRLKLLDGETTVFLGIPLHWGYLPALIGAGMLTAICGLVVYRHLRILGR